MLQMKFIDLFCGIGGFRVALEQLGGRCVFSSDIDGFAQKTYSHNFGERPEGDITKIEASSIPKFDILCAGFPCQPFSYAGRNEGFRDETRGTLFYEICRILEHHRPKMFLLENVKGLTSHERGKTLSKINEHLNKRLNYKIYSRVIDSHNFGVPQKRERWYCVGFDKEIEYQFPTGGPPLAKLRDIVDLNNTDSSLSIPDFELRRIEDHFKRASEGERVQHNNSLYAPHTKKGRHGVFSYQKPDGSLRFHIGDHAKTGIQEAFYSHLDTYACTIIANRVPKLWDIKRKLSVREAARLQGFPDSYEFPVSNAQAYKQLGNAVVVPVVKNILEKMIGYYEKNTL